ncbi:BTB domain-containing protein/F5_F8_type_C domain-containing protein/BACK domain-containing protein/Methyltransf_FA domain-containing protein [Cephalotus follicularis]|uniref:BTB domain-containing protein/F5_F8_type_C domain-containing protein/BACK domain-containing protein/Methyltransf_FA domain-containing protein n=1 Tax=Cephalotus follicularis TaxID=3775 RepID=A0A1Q3B639_CEPFO|nr:BTB domain-containing protein/F5_F8_type_C domain-containing protein/BACK domain-containing protein/Methyltransf_FA domain-containing protein [Cephalotus follicularis]
MEKKEKKFLTVAPFECAWRKDLKFREAGRGCVAFEAFAHNDVTVVFRENVGSQHYHYRRDNSPHYTVILGSHRNRRLKILVDGRTVVDVAGVGLCSSSAFQGYWISIYDGCICIGKGIYPFQNLVFQWMDSNPNCSVQYVGLSSWDKHVGYRNVNVLPLTQNHILLWKQVGCGESEGVEDVDEMSEDNLMGYEKWGLEDFLEGWELSDMCFIVGTEERPVPSHKVILQASGNFPLSSWGEDVIKLQGVTYPVLHALLHYIYTGHTQISESQLSSLWALSSQFEVMPLVKQCEETMERSELNKKLLDSGKNVELSYPSSRLHRTAFPFELPISVHRLQQFHSIGEYSDINIYIEGHGLVAQPHKVILSLWSVPFTKMFTNGMSESNSSEICLRDVSVEAFKAMLEFMYSGELNMEDTMDFGNLLLPLLLLADQFGVTLLHQECCKILLECLSEDSVCPILEAVSPFPSCKLIEKTCERKFAMHFDYCTTASLDFLLLDETNFCNIIQHPDLTVTSEERVLNAILMWGMNAKEFCGWEVVDELMKNDTLKFLFKERLHSVFDLLPFVRFPLLPYALLKKLEGSNLSRHISTFDYLVKEAISYIEFGLAGPGNDQNVRFQHRRSSFKELQYICDGDSNGVIYFAGTSYGEHPWVNPVLAKRITITASSPTSRFTDPKALVCRTYQGTFFAGPRMENGHTSAWWMVDFGQDHQLMCNYYTLRQDGSRAYIRFWSFQGSQDGKAWTNLRVHENDQTMCKPGQFASWPISGPNALLPFRFFRVVLTGSTTDASNPWNFCICFLELYGFFH